MHLLKTVAGLCLSPLVLGVLHDAAQQHLWVEPVRTKLSQTKLSDVISASPFLSLHRTLCEIESITDNELDIAKYLTNFLEAHNFTVVHQEVPPPKGTDKTKARWNIYAYPDSSKFSNGDVTAKVSKPKVLLSSHIDTVPPFIPYSLSAPDSQSDDLKREEILVKGRGTVDDKACVAAQLTAVMDLINDPDFDGRPEDLALLFVVGEEVRGDGMEHFSDSKLYHDTNANYKAVIFGEPTESKLASGHKGIFSLRLEAHGKAAHSGYPWLGQSALHMILPAVMALDRLGDIPEDEGGLPASDTFGKTTVNVGYFASGVAANVVPAYAEARIAFRLAGGTAERNKKIVINAIKEADPEGLLEYYFSQGYGPVYMDDDVPGFETIIVNYGTDVPNIKLDKGVKRYLYGPGSILVAHGEDEGLTVGALENSVVDYKNLIKHALNL